MADSFDIGIDRLKAMAEPTRLRLLALLQGGDLSVKDLTTILGQSQPRLSRHLKLLTDAGWITRYPEGAWVYYRLSDATDIRDLWQATYAHLGKGSDVLAQDQDRLVRLKEEQRQRAQSFFDDHAARWDALRADLVPEADVEASILKVLGKARVDSFLDIGTGTGRMLVLLADLYRQATGIDPSPAMLKVARSTLIEHGINHAQVRQGDGHALGIPAQSQDLVALHQVMHFFDDPRPMLAEVCRVLAPGGRLLIVDFAPHGVERLRSDHQHRRLGFDADEVSRWLSALGLSVEPVKTLGRDQSTHHQQLPVHIWVARDPRALVDAPVLSNASVLA
ncbi:MAG: metalloregulator ArsR/SmtB family transcription factor [Pseudomonadota bacterium]